MFEEDELSDEELIARSEFRDLWDAWKNGEIWFTEAAFIARRDIFFDKLLYLGFPNPIARLMVPFYDLLFESRCHVRDTTESDRV